MKDTTLGIPMCLDGYYATMSIVISTALSVCDDLVSMDFTVVLACLLVSYICRPVY